MPSGKMVQPAKKGRESSSELESKGSNKRQKSSDQAGQETRNAANTTKRQARVSGDQSASPSTSRKRSRGPLNDSDNTPDNSLAENTTTISEVDSANVPAIRDNAIEKRMELIKQLLEQKENELKEIAFLESGHNLLDYDPLGKGKLIPKEEPTDSVDAHKKGQRTPTSRTKRQSSDSLIQPSSAPQTPLQTTPLPTTPQATPGNYFSHNFLLFLIVIFLINFFILYYLFIFLFIDCITRCCSTPNPNPTTSILPIYLHHTTSNFRQGP